MSSTNHATVKFSLVEAAKAFVDDDNLADSNEGLALAKLATAMQDRAGLSNAIEFLFNTDGVLSSRFAEVSDDYPDVLVDTAQGWLGVALTLDELYNRGDAFILADPDINEFRDEDSGALLGTTFQWSVSVGSQSEDHYIVDDHIEGKFTAQIIHYHDSDPEIYWLS